MSNKKSKSGHACKKSYDSFLDPFELSMTPSELELQGQGDNSSSDEDYEPSFNLSLRLDHGLQSSESEEDDCNDDMEEEHDTEPYPCIKVVTTNAEVNDLLSDRPVLVYMDVLLSLARANVHHVCGVKGCGQDIHITS